MSRLVLCTVLAFFVIGCVQAQFGGYSHVPEHKYGNLLQTINGLTHAGEFAGARLVKVNCAVSQVVAGFSYIVNGEWQFGSTQKTCSINYTENLKDEIIVHSINCEQPQQCVDLVSTFPSFG